MDEQKSNRANNTKTIKYISLLAFSAIFSVFFSNSVYAFGTITSGTFDEPPDDEEIAEWYAVYEEDDKYTVDKFAGVGLVMPAACSSGSIIPHNRQNADGMHEDYLSFAPETARRFTFTSDDESIATADSTAFYCNGVGRTTIHINNNVYSPVRYKYPDIHFEIVVYDIDVSDEAIRSQVTTTINKAMLVLANGGEMPTSIDDATAQMLYDILITGKKLDAVLGINLITEDNIPNEELDKINQQIENEEVVAAYYDIGIETSEENVDGIGHINELEDSIEAVVDLPELPEIAKGYKREFFAIRIHNGVAERINDVTIENNKAKIPTDRFSIYALAYSDTIDIKAPNTGSIAVENNAASFDYTAIAIAAIALAGPFVAFVVTKKTYKV